jgi:hypothetical protein
LVLEIIDLTLQKVDLLIEGEDDVLHGFAIHLEITSVICDHEVIGIESTFHHPLALEDLLLHSFEPNIHGPHPLGALDVPDVEHPLTHLNGLRVLHHLPQIRVDDVLEELVLGGARSGHGNLNLSENSKKEQQKISPRYGGQYIWGVYKDFLSWKTSKREKNGVWKVTEVGTTHRGAPGGPDVPWCLVPTRVAFPVVSYFPNFCYIPKLTKK